MVYFTSLLGASLFAGLAAALPRPDSASGGEVAVSAPNGVILSDTAELASQLSSASAASAYVSSYPAQVTSSYAAAYTSSSASSGYGSGYGNSGYGNSGYGGDSSYSSSSVDNSYNTATATYSASSSMMTYGSGYNNWGGSGYDDCVNQCIASYGAPPSTWTPPPYSGSEDSSHNHTVIVAPMQGVLRFVPPFVNASVGDNIHFVWMANNHTVTKSSAILPCNKSDDNPFATGTQNKGFTFDERVNDTSTVFFYCGTPGHCPKGMFGAINPPTLPGGNTSVESMMPMMTSNDSSMSAMWSYTNSMSSKYNASAQAMSWGSHYDMASMPEWSHGPMMENIMYTRVFLAMNPDVLSADGKIDMTGSRAPIQFPQDITTALSGNNAASGSLAANPSTSDSSSASATSASASSTPTQKNGARSNVASGAFVGAFVLVATVLAL